jgi:hypothetical protein
VVIFSPGTAKFELEDLVLGMGCLLQATTKMEDLFRVVVNWWYDCV